jgi:3-dehydroquinate dehydratase / shikimate dehydrogenase
MKQNTRICVPVTGRDYSNMMEQYNRACATADVVEFRLDYLDPSEISTAPARLSESTSHDRVQKIFTYRPKEQGGSRDLTFEERLRFWSDNLSLFEQEQVLVDLEYDLCIELSSCGTDSPVKDWGSVICSYHDFQGVPDEISKIYEKLSSTPASIIKLALKADDLTDCITLFSLLDRANRENRGLIAILMGAPGMVTRILGPSRGSYLTFASLNRDLSTAPGQLTSTDLLNLYHIKDLTSRSMVTGLVGNPVAHSVSPHMHNAAFSELSLDAVYVPLEVRDAPAFLKRMVHPRTRELDWGLRGLSVTAPHKQSVMDGLDTIDDAAREMGAVNTIVIDKDRLHGTNTDVG